MKLSQLLENIVGNDKLEQSLNHIEIKGISANSSKIGQNDLFIAISGYQQDGHNYIDDAIAAGACAVVGEKEIEQLNVPYVRVSNSRLALAQIASAFYQTSSKKHITIGITGTNGKTTTSFMLKHILEDAGFSCSLFGSIYNIVNGQISTSPNTTIDALELHRLLSISRDDIVIIEVSSHGLLQFRIEGIEFDYCLFTNLDHEHLDYHQSMDDYFSVKASLFNQLKPDGKAIINSYNSWGEKLFHSLKCKVQNVIAMGEAGNNHLQITRCKTGEPANAVLAEGDEKYQLNLKIFGRHNLYNAAMAFLTIKNLNIPGEEIIQSLQTFRGVPGRFEIIEHPKEATVVIDYAHTSDAFFHCLSTAREHGARRIFHVFGFRGNRDESKRMGMLNMSYELSDEIILTLDDLNHISYEEMVTTLHGLNNPQKALIIPDRTLAIQYSVDNAEKGDWIIITGKGGEKYHQQFVLPATSDEETIRYLCGKT
ncbi:UDP-N-acetylmuramoyl-L-alanyl-D-glutamate--2,6-diaminopimelate ligase [Bacillus sp. DTU_2020_1000418_1_SI_GHA_SEK_038]|uniref:UDP-N-acetylmuramoyl-L-alanyl-D-glutamate--2, 6-diaminopimelate ligase n=1 Tax=Bacillus sp. DTU_2020_1000418_1_SI_GHA_SEK_038 TaxID=3077585 RepID=UPI0028EEC40F|nr:UDP-N-acetylmuramoyl-L-alanyl-D-glutamate--2,6-diaminopimelate ligase [Bacillus sp. DTU_2020_1000418_1_SI_GHA_SEK_038]WNS74996.1 UDP-N-acetylmuramoyl-L-alanyl-D-glutamate--2,6-diaminopimelate ligase [Bacillus sp. DTU_2020_1000418_1_SI_GHA_SEK_038]